MTDHEGEGSGIKNLVLFAGRKTWRRICFWSNDATNMLIDLWPEETIQFALESSKTSKETREGYSTLRVSNTFYLVQFDNSRLSI